MSYSYLQNVFPKYRPSQKLTELMYNDIINSNTVREPVKYEAANDTTPHASLDQINSKPLVVEQQEDRKEGSKETPKENQDKTFLETFQDNLKFYNEPLKTSFIENLENTDTKLEHCNEESCADNINHIIKCEVCSAILKQKLGIGSDFNEYIEIAMYILFGLFIIAILDKLDKR